MNTNRFSTYFLGGFNLTNHQHIFRARFYDATVVPEGVSIAQWTAEVLAGQMGQVGP